MEHAAGSTVRRRSSRSSRRWSSWDRAPRGLVPRDLSPKDLSPKGLALRDLRRDDRGAVTAELAVALPAVVLVLVALLVVVVAGVSQIRVVDAARSGARAASAGESPGRVQEVVSQAAGGSASATVSGDDTWVTVTVRTSVTGGWFSGPFTVSASATARLESAAGAP